MKLQRQANGKIMALREAGDLNAAKTYCEGEYLNQYGSYRHSSSTLMIDKEYPVSKCISDGTAAIAEYNAEQERKEQERLKAEKAEAERLAREEQERAEQERLNQEKKAALEVAESLVTSQQAYTIARRVKELYSARMLNQVVAEDQMCWKIARSRSAIVECSIRTLAGGFVVNLPPKTYVPYYSQKGAVKETLWSNTSKKLSMNDSQVDDFQGTYVSPHIEVIFISIAQ